MSNGTQHKWCNGADENSRYFIHLIKLTDLLNKGKPNINWKEKG